MTKQFYTRNLHRVTGSAGAAIFLGWLLQQQPDADGWIHAPMDVIQAETGLSRQSQLHARGRLRTLGLIEVRYARYKHVWCRVTSLLWEYLQQGRAHPYHLSRLQGGENEH